MQLLATKSEMCVHRSKQTHACSPLKLFTLRNYTPLSSDQHCCCQNSNETIYLSCFISSNMITFLVYFPPLVVLSHMPSLSFPHVLSLRLHTFFSLSCILLSSHPVLASLRLFSPFTLSPHNPPLPIKVRITGGNISGSYTDAGPTLLLPVFPWFPW